MAKSKKKVVDEIANTIGKIKIVRVATPKGHRFTLTFDLEDDKLAKLEER